MQTSTQTTQTQTMIYVEEGGGSEETKWWGVSRIYKKGGKEGGGKNEEISFEIWLTVSMQIYIIL